ncbi:MAG: 4-alpha-glucanotransferase [Clostridia bacterium]|nr:4-alpha-glucanotransferase [Clostridia bacterium]
MRKAGILMHISSLPTDFGIGTIGKDAFEFVDFLKRTGQSCWQVLPLHPTEFGNSPYQSPSVFAGNPLLIDLTELKNQGLLWGEDFDGIFFGSDEEKVDFEAVKAYKNDILEKAFSRFHITPEYNAFSSENAYWLDDFALYMALKEHFDQKPWYEWDEGIKNHTTAAVQKYTNELWNRIELYKFRQYIFYSQWSKLKEYANSNGIEIIGDIPIYVALDSCDVWTNRKLFQLDADGTPKAIAGCPPDAFSADGQLWGNPLYDWSVMSEDGYSWWISRLSTSMKLYDIIRLDHFRGFEAYYAIPYGDTDAKRGEWKKGPGMSLFNSVKNRVPEVQIIAEDLGYLTEDVHELLKKSGFPGMKVLQFAFDPYNDNPYLPYNYPENCVAYTGTHDNDTIIGWYENEPNKEFIRDYLDVGTDDLVPVAMVRTILASRAKLAVIPIQDYLGYGRRMNTPSTANDENWSYRIKKGALHDGVAYHIEHLTRLYKRSLHKN